MDAIFQVITTGTALSSATAGELHERGFVVLPGPVESVDMERVTSAYDTMWRRRASTTYTPEEWHLDGSANMLLAARWGAAVSAERTVSSLCSAGFTSRW